MKIIPAAFVPGPSTRMPSVAVSAIPVFALLASLVCTIVLRGADSVLDMSPWLLGGAAGIALALTLVTTRRPLILLWYGLVRSGRQILPAVPILLLIGTLSASWMLSGTVPLLIDRGLALLSPGLFLPSACAVCAIVSVLTGSSWTTVATIGVAFMGIGSILGFSPAWTAGAIISGAYFGDKVSPLSDTTVLASSSCNVTLFSHIRNMMTTTVPAMAVALGVYFAAGVVMTSDAGVTMSGDMRAALGETFNLSPWLAIVPLFTCIMIAMRLPTLLILAAGTCSGVAAMWLGQPEIMSWLMAGGDGAFTATAKAILFPVVLDTGSTSLDNLASTGGLVGMLPTIWLILGAMLFGGAMIGSGMLKVLTRAFVRRLRRRHSLVGATVASGLFLNACTGDQYISLVIGGNVYRPAYRRARLRPELLSRSLEDSISVTSVLIPWNSCGMTQATVLGVATLVYAPFCIFNIMSPVMSVAVAWLQARRDGSRQLAEA